MTRTEFTWDNYVDFINKVPPPQDELDFFKSIDWLQPYFGPSSPYKPIPFFSRYEKGSTLDRFFNKTLKSEETIPHSIALIPKHQDWDTRLARAANNTPQATKKGEPEWDYILLCDLREDLSGHVNTAHGGVLGALFDEAMGCCTGTFRQENPMFTAYLNVQYRAPVEMPCVVLFRIRLDRRQGRKWFLRGDLVGKDGKAMTESECLYVSVQPKEKL